MNEIAEPIEVEEEGYYEEPDRRSEIIASCYNAIAGTEYYDTGMESKVNLERIKRVKRMSLRIIDYYISEIYAEHFDEED